MSVVEMKTIVKRYGSTLAVDNVDMEITEGEIVGLVGPNGAGKTTLIHAMTGLIGIDSGEIKVFGKHFDSKTLEAKHKIGLVTQDITIYEELTAQENLEFFGGIYGLKGRELKQRVAETLEIVGLEDQAKKTPNKFSGGMKRRLNIACALTHRPKLIIMDEPTVGIDPQSRNYILETVRRLKEQGTTILYTTHYMEEVQAIASRVLIMDQGHVIAQGTIDELIENIQYEESIFLEVMEPNEELLETFRSLGGVKQVKLKGKQVHIISNAGSENLDRILSVAQSAGGVRSVKTEKPTLEDVFLTLTGKTLRDGEAE